MILVQVSLYYGGFYLIFRVFLACSAVLHENLIMSSSSQENAKVGLRCVLSKVNPADTFASCLRKAHFIIILTSIPSRCFSSDFPSYSRAYIIGVLHL